MTGIVQAGACLVGALVAGLLGGVAFSAPPSEEPFPEIKRHPSRELTELDRAVLQAAGDLQHKQPPGSPPDAAAFLLWLYREDGDRKNLDWAMGKARELAREGLERGGVAALYQTARAGSPTRVEAEDAYRRRQEETSSASGLSTELYANLMLDGFARAALLNTPSAMADALFATGSFWQSRTHKDGSALRVLTEDGNPEGLVGHVAALRVGIEATALSGSTSVRDECRLLAHEILAKFWDDGREQFVDREVMVVESPIFGDRGAPIPGVPGASGQTASLSDTRVANARAALAVWEMGMVCGDQLLIGRGRRALESGLPSGLADPMASPSLGLAAGRMSRHPVQMALIGQAAEPVLVSLRQAAYAVFEPAKLMLSLDPATDAARFAELLYPPDLAPALFICVETVCSPPITQAEGLPERVREIRKLAADTPE